MNLSPAQLEQLRAWLSIIAPNLARITYLKRHIDQGLWDPIAHTGALIQGIKNFALETGMAIATVSADGIHHVNLKPPAKGGGYSSLSFVGSHEIEPIAWCQAFAQTWDYAAAKGRVE